MQDKREWLTFLTQETCKSDARVFKRMLKSFLGGKKVGKN
jgi:transportin-3